jgi:hypothetical protein
MSQQLAATILGRMNLQGRVQRPENTYGRAVLVDEMGKRVIVGQFVGEQPGK